MAVDISSYVVANRPLPLKDYDFDRWWDDIIDSGIMDLNYGIFTDGDYAMVVLPEIHTSDDTHENILMRVLNKKHRGRTRQWWRGAGSTKMEGTYDVRALMFYNPSAPSLYLVYASDGDEGLMGTIPVHRKSGKQIMKMTNEMLRDSVSPWISKARRTSGRDSTTPRSDRSGYSGSHPTLGSQR